MSNADAEIENALSPRARLLLDETGKIECDDPLFARFLDHMRRDFSEHPHAIRYCKTFAFIMQNGIDFDGKAICDSGGSPMLNFLADAGHDATPTRSDLRYEIDRPDESVDIFLSLEVIEHIKDHDSDDRKDVVLFNRSGVETYVSEIRRVLKPGGWVFLTTPNPNSALVLHRVLNDSPPLIYAQHVREYTAQELREIFSDFDEQRYSTEFCFGLFDENRRKIFLEENFGDKSLTFMDKGDDHFFAFRKPATDEVVASVD
ncbi:MAG: methyltransferase domain-containing protein [Pseudomonadota bacterium]